MMDLQFGSTSHGKIEIILRKLKDEDTQWKHHLNHKLFESDKWLTQVQIPGSHVFQWIKFILSNLGKTMVTQ